MEINETSRTRSPEIYNKYFYLEDEYAGLMSARDKQFITNIQLNQEISYNQDFHIN